jgi:hypothetical protein
MGYYEREKNEGTYVRNLRKGRNENSLLLSNLFL